MEGFGTNAMLCLALMSFWIPLASQGQQIVSSPVRRTEVRGGDVSLPCRVKSLGANNVIWLHGSRVLTMNQMTLVNDPRLSVQREKLADNIYRYDLAIRDIKGADNGTYRCQVTSDNMVEQISILYVQVPAVVTDFSPAEEATASLGDNITLTCTATGTPHPNVSWSKEGSEDEHFGGSLVLTSLEPDDGGVYKCTAKNGVGTPDSVTVRLAVVYAPIIHPGPKVVRTGPGHVAILPCDVSGLPTPTVQWRHNGSVLDLRALPQHREIVNEVVGTRHDYALRIEGVRDEDLGLYKCKVKNNLGSASTSLRLAANPGRVEVISYENGAFSNQYTLKWNVSAVVNPTRYTLTLSQLVNGSYAEDLGSRDFRPSTSRDDLEHHVHSYDITGLKPQTTYRITLTAHNRYGSGMPSKPFVFRTNRAGFSPPPPTRPSLDLVTLAPREPQPKDDGKNQGVTWAPSLLPLAILEAAVFALKRHFL